MHREFEITYDDGKGNIKVVQFISPAVTPIMVAMQFEERHPGTKVLEVR